MQIFLEMMMVLYQIIGFIKVNSIMGLKRSEIIEYLVKEQGYNEKTVREMEIYELIDLYEMFHED